MIVEDFFEAQVQFRHREIEQKLRQLKDELAPGNTEVLTHGIPGFPARDAVASPTKTDIILAFSRGAAFDYDCGLLQGVAKVSKNPKFKAVSDVEKPVLAYYVKQALMTEAK